ncbi:MAG: zeta toxin family protein [Propionibacteriaceae bacterium]|jgi:predicted ABC-type ATPase|nr:zeta toxin family protein [Propionibacteriaceae bacterium]
MPVLHLLAGPNGAGKTTYATRVLIPATRLTFINADVIAAQIWPDHESDHGYEAAQIAQEHRREFMERGESFISETVFSHTSKVDLLADASAMGYLIHLHVILVPLELTIQRVTERVRRGGHSVPEEKIRGRYARLWDYVGAGLKIADVGEVLDNSSARYPFRVCARFFHGSVIGTPTWPQWAPSVLLRF